MSQQFFEQPILNSPYADSRRARCPVGRRVAVVAVGTKHLAKGLEFRAVAVAASDDEVLEADR